MKKCPGLNPLWYVKNKIGKECTGTHIFQRHTGTGNFLSINQYRHRQINSLKELTGSFVEPEMEFFAEAGEYEPALAPGCCCVT